MIDWIHAGPTVVTAFLGSLVECVEALTIVLAVGTVRGWRSALLGTGAGLAALTALVVILGPALGVIPVTVLQVVIGLLLLLFGLSWLRKAVLRAAGAIPLHDERSAFESATSALCRTGAATSSRWDTIAIITSFKAVVLEGIEVVFIVLAVGAAGHRIVPASLGAAGAGIGVALAALALRRPLARVPENTLKLSVGVLIGSFGAFWIGEGLGFHWPGADLAILGLVGAFLIVSLLTIAVLQRTRPETFGHLGRGMHRARTQTGARLSPGLPDRRRAARGRHHGHRDPGLLHVALRGPQAPAPLSDVTDPCAGTSSRPRRAP